MKTRHCIEHEVSQRVVQAIHTNPLGLKEPTVTGGVHTWTGTEAELEKGLIRLKLYTNGREEYGRNCIDEFHIRLKPSWRGRLKRLLEYLHALWFKRPRWWLSKPNDDGSVQ